MIRSLLRPITDRLKYHLSLPTARAVTLLVAAFLLYLFGNQTQVGWMFVMSALLAGTVLAAWMLNRRALRGVVVEREMGGAPNAELYEGETVSVKLTLRNAARILAAQVRAAERCPLAALDSARRRMDLFVPLITPRRGGACFEYEVEIDRRGVHLFPPVELSSRAPFGFFRRQRRIDLPTRVLVYPEVRRLQRFRLLDHRLALEFVRPRAGVGTEILGVRPFRSGDSPRRIHWRSVARTGRLISKEFVDESRPGLTLILDVCRHPYPPTASKHTPFEWAVKVAASIGDYTQRCGYPLHLLADGDAWPPPGGPVVQMQLLEYLARVNPIGGRALAEVMDREPPLATPCVAAILPWPDADVLEPLVELRRRGLAVFAVLLDPASFPVGGPSAGPLADGMRAADLEVSLVRFGEDWRGQLDSVGRIANLPHEVEDYAYAGEKSAL
ncbi:MAG: DUF58 domain-containing protein [Anaerolineae bacterium]|nr:DUF58 domain-containing protein [Anaerolineae bacterium]